MKEIIISRHQAEQFALDIFDVLIQDIKAQEAKEQKTTTCEAHQTKERAA